MEGKGEAPRGRPLVRSLGFEPAFDGMRGVAVLLVVSLHVRLLAPSLYGRAVPKAGFLGVDAFFVLSGFLITALLLREQATTGRVRLGAFYRRRALRLLPALFALVAVQLVYAYLTHVPETLERSSVLSVIFYGANWKIVYGQGWPLIAPGLAHTWSLAIEEQFYLVWPLLVIALLGVTRRLSTALALIGAAIVAVVVWRATLVGHQAPGVVYFRTDARADALLIGALCAQVWTRGRIPLRRALVPAAWVCLAFVAVCVLRLEVADRFLLNGGFTAVSVAVAIMLLAVLETRWLFRRVLTLGPLRAVGRVSYGVYLWHYFVFFVISEQAADWAFGARIATGFALTAMLTVISWTVVERPFLRWKDRLEQRAGPERIAVPAIAGARRPVASESSL